MKKLLLLLLIVPVLGYGQVLDKKVARIAKKKIEIFLSPKYNSNEPIIIVAKKCNRKVNSLTPENHINSLEILKITQRGAVFDYPV